MSTYNPRIVAQALADLTEEMARWTFAARDTLAMASYAQLQARERVDRTVHHAAIVFDQAEQDEERVQRAISESDDLTRKCLAARDQSSETLDEARTALQHAEATLQEWEEELAKALAWLQRAEARLARAIQEYEQARRAFAAAQSAYERAVARYNACANNRERTNCDSEASAVRAAEAEMRQAAAWVQAAEAEVIAARAEVEMAKARVACCRRAVGYATQAVSLSREAEAEAAQAANSAERGLEFAQAAEKLIEGARENVAAEKEAAEHMKATTREAVALADEAAAYLTSADKAEETSQRYSLSARQELQYRMEQLHELNRPNLLAAAANTAAIQPVSSKSGYSRSSNNTLEFTDKQGRKMAIHNYSGEDYAYIRAFDLALGPPPKIASLGIGQANAAAEVDNGVKRIKFGDVFVNPTYRGAGIGERLVEQVIQFARDQKAEEIYGVIENENARSFWSSQTSKGWRIVDNTRSVYGEAHYKLEN